MKLWCQAITSQGPSYPLPYEACYQVDVRFGSPICCCFTGFAFGFIGHSRCYCCSPSFFFAHSICLCLSSQYGYCASPFSRHYHRSTFPHCFSLVEHANVTTMNALKILPPFSSTSLYSPSIVLASMMPSSSSRPSVSLDHVYTSRDIDLMQSMGYRSVIEAVPESNKHENAVTRK